MSRRFIFLLVATVVMLYFSIILFMLKPLHTVHGDAFSMRFPFRQAAIVDWCKPLRWREPPQDVVALVSYPGSGNTWLRYLLQQATGIITGSVYRDHGLQLHGFPGEEVTNGSVLVVKTHEENLNFQSAVMLIRNPRDAILAEFHRLWRGHIGTAPKSVFQKRVRNTNSRINKNNSRSSKGTKREHPEWLYHFKSQLKWWESLHVTWLTKFLGPIHIVFYDHLVKDTRNILAGILEFLNTTVTEDDLYCTLMHREGIYRRRNKLQNFDPYSPQMYEELNAVKTKVYNLVNDYKKKHNYTKKHRVNSN